MFLFFDLDGVILDTEHPALKLWKKNLRAEYVDFLWERCLGITQADEQICFNRVLGWSTQEYSEFLKKVKVVPRVRSEALETLTELKLEHTLVLVTSSSQKSTAKKLKLCGLEGIFSEIITADDVARGKPYTDPYTLAKLRVGATNSESIVIEDALSGVFSAYQSGIPNIIFFEDTVKSPALFKDVLLGVAKNFNQLLELIRKKAN